MNQEKCYRYNLMQVPVLHVVPFIWYTKMGGWCLLFLRIRDVHVLQCRFVLSSYFVRILWNDLNFGRGYTNHYSL